MPNVLLLFISILLFVCPITANTQTVHKMRGDREKIISTVGQAGNKQNIEKALSLFDKKTLKELLKSFGLLKKEKTKQELIDSIIDNLPIIVKRKDEIDLPFFKRSWYKLNEKYAKSVPSLTRGSEFVVYEAARILYIDKEDKKGFKHIILFGEVLLEIGSFSLKADLVSIKMDAKTNPIEAFALGNIFINNDSNNRIVSKKAYFFPQIDRSILSSPIAYFSPFYFKAASGKRLADGKYSFKNGFVTNDNVKNLHYRLNFNKAWYYSDEIVWVQGVTYVVGSSNMFWSPLLFKSKLLTGVLTSLGYEDGVGWYTNNTIFYIPGESISHTRQKRVKSISGTSLGLKFMLDYYQRLGVYFGNEFSFNKYGLSFKANTAIAYDRSLDYINAKFTNSFDHVGNDRIPEETNNFRWSFDSDLRYSLFSGGGASSSLSVSFKTQSDPSFNKQFNSRRTYPFDLFDVFDLYNKKTPHGITSLGGSESQSINFSINTSINSFRLDISGAFNYLLQFDLTDKSKLPLNAFASSSYKQYLSSITLPKISLSYSNSIQLIGTAVVAQETKEEEEVKDFVKIFLDDAGNKEAETTKEDSSTKEDANKAKTYEDVLKDLEKDEDLRLSLPINFSLSSSIEETRRYKTDATNKLNTDIAYSSNSFRISVPFTISYDFISFTLTSNSFTNYNLRQTKNATTSEKKYDTESTYPYWGTQVSGNISFTFLEEYEYLKLRLSGSVSYSKNDRFTAPKKEGTVYKDTSSRSENVAYSSSFEFLKSRLSVSLSDNLYINPYDMELIQKGIKTKSQLLKEQRSNLSVSLSSNPVDFISISNSFAYSRKKNENISNSFSINIGYSKGIEITDSFYLRSISFNNSWYKHYINPLSDSLSTSFQISFSITKYWIINFNVSATNNSLYRYNEADAAKYGRTKRNFFTDLFDSFNFFNTAARQRSLFKLNGLNLSIVHDLHEWSVQFDVNLRFKEFKTGIYFFEPSVYVSLYLKVMPSITYPKIEKVFTKQ